MHWPVFWLPVSCCITSYRLSPVLLTELLNPNLHYTQKFKKKKKSSEKLHWRSWLRLSEIKLQNFFTCQKNSKLLYVKLFFQVPNFYSPRETGYWHLGSCCILFHLWIFACCWIFASVFQIFNPVLVVTIYEIKHSIEHNRVSEGKLGFTALDRGSLFNENLHQKKPQYP